MITRALAGVFFLCLWIQPAFSQAADAGRTAFETRCAVCHGGDGKGGEFAPGILARVAALGDPELTALVRSGVPSKGMPAFNLVVTEMAPLLTYLRLLAETNGTAPPLKKSKFNIGGQSIEGTVLHEGIDDVQLRTSDGRRQLLRRARDLYRVGTSQSDWTSYDGQTNGNRYS